MSGEDGTGGTGSPTAALDALKADAAFMGRVDARDATAQAQLDQAYKAAYPDEAAGDEAGGVRVDRGTGADVPSTHQAYGVLPELEAAADPAQLTAFREAAHQAGLARGDFAEVAGRYYAIAAGAEATATPEECNKALTRWHGDEAPKILAAAQSAVRRTLEKNPELEEVFAAIGNDVTSVTLLGLHELAKGRR